MVVWDERFGSENNNLIINSFINQIVIIHLSQFELEHYDFAEINGINLNKSISAFLE